jgi:nitrogen regulatory protein PII
MDNTIAMKRLEIVISKDKFSKIASLFSRSDIRGYTIIKHAGGLGSRGPVENGDVTLNDGNVVVILACQEKKAQKVLAEIHPIMKELGGMCLISDCLWLEKPKASY